MLEHALFGSSIPYRVYGGLRFFERAEVKHALAYLRLIANPSDDTSFLRVANFPPRGIGARSMEQLQDTAKQKGVSLFEGRGFFSRKNLYPLKNWFRIYSRRPKDLPLRRRSST